MTTTASLTERARAISLQVRDKGLMTREPFVAAMEILVGRFTGAPLRILAEMQEAEKAMDAQVVLLSDAQVILADMRAKVRALKDQIDEKETLILAGNADAKNDIQRKAAVASARREDPDLKTLIAQRDDTEDIARGQESLLARYEREWAVMGHKLHDRRAFLRIVVGGEQ